MKLFQILFPWKGKEYAEECQKVLCEAGCRIIGYGHVDFPGHPNAYAIFFRVLGPKPLYMALLQSGNYKVEDFNGCPLLRSTE